MDIQFEGYKNPKRTREIMKRVIELEAEVYVPSQRYLEYYICTDTGYDIVSEVESYIQADIHNMFVYISDCMYIIITCDRKTGESEIIDVATTDKLKFSEFIAFKNAMINVMRANGVRKIIADAKIDTSDKLIKYLCRKDFRVIKTGTSVNGSEFKYYELGLRDPS